MDKKKITEFIKEKVNQVVVIAFLLIAYSTTKILSIVPFMFGIGYDRFNLLFYSIVPYILIIFASICVIQGRKAGWYSISALGMIFVLDLLILLFSFVVVYCFRQPFDLLKVIQNPRPIMQLILGVLGFLLVRLFMNENVISKFKVQIRNKLLRILIIVVIATIAVFSYYRFGLFLYSENLH